MVVPIRSCCFIFNLRQGTMLMAVVELILSAISLFLLLLASGHAQEMVDIAERQQLPMDDETRIRLHLHTAQHLALVMIICVYSGIAIVTIHLISCVLLLYGSIMQIRQFILPWISLVLITLVMSFTSLLVCMIMRYGTQSSLIIFSLVIQIRFVLWLVVFSFYREICEKQSANCAVYAQQDMMSIEAGYVYPMTQSGKPSNV